MKRVILIVAVLLGIFSVLAGSGVIDLRPRSVTRMLAEGPLPQSFNQGDIEISVVGLVRDDQTNDLIVLLRARRGDVQLFGPDQPFIFRNVPGAIKSDRLTALRDLIGEAVRVSVNQAGSSKGDDPVLTVFPDPGKPGTTSCVGDVGTNANATYAGARATPDCVDCSTAEVITTENSIGGVPPTFSVIRALTNFDTSALGSRASITAATFSIKPTGTHFDFKTGDFVRLVLNTIVSNVNYATRDFTLFGTASQATADFPIANFVTGAYADFTLSATGRGHISKTGITHFGLRVGGDISNSQPVADTDPGFPSKGGAVVFFYSADMNGTDNDPKLVITYTLPPSAKKRLFEIGGCWQGQDCLVLGAHLSDSDFPGE